MPSSARRARCPRVPEATALTDRSNFTRTADPEATVSQRSLTRATGARSVRRSWRSFPSAQPSQPGRRTTTSTDTRSPGVSRARGVRRPPRTESGIPCPSGPNARARTSVPPNGCTSTRASAVASAASLAPDHAHTAATNPSSATATTVPKPNSARRRARRAKGRSRGGKKGERADPTATSRA